MHLLPEYDFKIVYRFRAINVRADYVSRIKHRRTYLVSVCLEDSPCSHEAEGQPVLETRLQNTVRYLTGKTARNKSRREV